MPKVFGIISPNVSSVAGLGILSTRDEVKVEDILVSAANDVLISVSPGPSAKPNVFYQITLIVDANITRLAQAAWSVSDIASNKRFRIPFRSVGTIGDNYIVEITSTINPVTNIIIIDSSGSTGALIDIPVIMQTVPTSGLAGYQIEFNIDSSVIGFNDVVFPIDFGLSSHTPTILTGRDKKVTASGVNVPDTIIGGERDVLLCTLQVRANRVGTANIGGIVIRIDDDAGSPIAATFEIGTVVIS